VAQEFPSQVPVAELPERLDLSRARVYDLLSALRIQPRRVGRASYVSAEHYGQLLQCRDALKRGVTLAAYLDQHPPEMEVEPPAAGLLTDSSNGPEHFMAAVLALLQQQQLALAPAEQPDTTLDTIERRLRILQQLADGGLSIPNGELADVLDVAPGTLRGRGQQFEAYGLVFRRESSGRTVSWRVSRPG